MDPATFFGSAMRPLVAWVTVQEAAAQNLLASGPVGVSSALCVLAALLCYIGQASTGYWSYVDRCWSLLPMAYAASFVLFDAHASPRVVLMTGLVAIWGIRLTANFWRKGGYGAEEDYRWPVLREWIAAAPAAPLARETFSFLFVAVYQHALIFAFVVPPFFVAASSAVPLGAFDAALAAVFLFAVALETWTDEVQWAFQKRKYELTPLARTAAGGDFARGFCTCGPFAVSRHLNFFAEQSLWWAVWGFTVAAGAPLPNWSAIGALLLTALFQGSTWMTELLTRNKYPTYAAYQARVSRLLPWFPGGASNDAFDVLTSTANLPAPATKSGKSSIRRRKSFSH